MSLTIKTTPELEEKLREDAERNGTDAASYALRLLQERYAVAVPAPTLVAPTAGALRWHSVSGLDADAVEDRRRSAAPEVSPSHSRHRVSHRERRRLRRRKIWARVVTVVVGAIVLAAIVAGLVSFVNHRAHPPVHAAPRKG